MVIEWKIELQAVIENKIISQNIVVNKYLLIVNIEIQTQISFQQTINIIVFGRVKK